MISLTPIPVTIYLTFYLGVSKRKRKEGPACDISDVETTRDAGKTVPPDLIEQDFPVREKSFVAPW